MTKFHTHTKTTIGRIITILNILIFQFLDGRRKTKNSEQNGSKLNPNLICS